MKVRPPKQVDQGKIQMLFDKSKAYAEATDIPSGWKSTEFTILKEYNNTSQNIRMADKFLYSNKTMDCRKPVSKHNKNSSMANQTLYYQLKANKANKRSK